MDRTGLGLFSPVLTHSGTTTSTCAHRQSGCQADEVDRDAVPRKAVLTYQIESLYGTFILLLVDADDLADPASVAAFRDDDSIPGYDWLHVDTLFLPFGVSLESPGIHSSIGLGSIADVSFGGQRAQIVVFPSVLPCPGGIVQARSECDVLLPESPSQLRSFVLLTALESPSRGLGLGQCGPSKDLLHCRWGRYCARPLLLKGFAAVYGT